MNVIEILQLKMLILKNTCIPLFPATLPKSSSFSRSGPGSQLNAKLQKAQSFDVAR